MPIYVNIFKRALSLDVAIIIRVHHIYAHKFLSIVRTLFTLEYGLFKEIPQIYHCLKLNFDLAFSVLVKVVLWWGVQPINTKDDALWDRREYTTLEAPHIKWHSGVGRTAQRGPLQFYIGELYGMGELWLCDLQVKTNMHEQDILRIQQLTKLDVSTNCFIYFPMCFVINRIEFLYTSYH